MTDSRSHGVHINRSDTVAIWDRPCCPECGGAQEVVRDCDLIKNGLSAAFALVCKTCKLGKDISRYVCTLGWCPRCSNALRIISLDPGVSFAPGYKIICEPCLATLIVDHDMPGNLRGLTAQEWQAWKQDNPEQYLRCKYTVIEMRVNRDDEGGKLDKYPKFARGKK